MSENKEKTTVVQKSSDENPNSKIIPLNIKNKFYSEYFGSFEGSSIVNDEGINTAIINCDNPKDMLNKINGNITIEFTRFIEDNMGVTAQLYDRSTIYETEIKENTIFIRWSGSSK